MTTPRTLFEKVWDAHVVREGAGDAPSVLYVDLHLLHEVTSPQAFTVLHERGLRVRRPDRTIATMDHSTPTAPTGGSLTVLDPAAHRQLDALSANCAEHDVPLYGLGDERRGIVHVIGPELGRTQPGMTIVCGDSHTSTHGAFGALAFGIGTSEVGHVLATQCLLQSKPKTMEVRVDGRLRPGVSAKDLILAIIAKIGVGGGTGHVIEYRGEAIRALDRFFLSTYAYQIAGHGLPEEEVREANRFATGGLVPDLTLLLTYPVREGLARAAHRDSAHDRMEAMGEPGFRYYKTPHTPSSMSFKWTMLSVWLPSTMTRMTCCPSPLSATRRMRRIPAEGRHTWRSPIILTTRWATQRLEMGWRRGSNSSIQLPDMT